MTDALQYCTICRKPFTKASSLKRHVSYCRRTQSKPKKRQTSCLACNRLKVKCSFQIPCSRCTSRGTECIYDSARGAGNVNSTPEVTIPDVVPSAGPLDISVLDSEFNFELTPEGSWEDELDFTATSPTPYSQNSTYNNDAEALTLSMSFPKSQIFSGLSMGSPTRDMLLDSYKVIGTIKDYRGKDPVLQRSANLLLHSLRTFPEKMLNNDDLPYFIHSPSKDKPLPEPLIACQRVCQMFVTRTPESLPFIWRCIKMEEIRFRNDDLTTEEIIAASQAQVIYITMMVIESGLRRLDWAQEMLMTSGAVCVRLQDSYNKYFNEVAQLDHVRGWDHWVLEESLRRTHLVWIIMGLVFHMQNGLTYNDLATIRALHLPSSKLQWEAADAPMWEQRMGITGSEDMQTVGELLDIYSKCENPASIRKLDSWNSRADQLGSMLNLAIGML